MIRQLHRWPGLLALPIVVALAISGAALSLFPAMDALHTPPLDATMSVADLAQHIVTAQDGVEQIRRSPSGEITAYWFDINGAGSAVIAPATGLPVAGIGDTGAERWLTRFHRAFLMGDGGRLVAAFGAAAMLVLAIGGIALLARRNGGWQHLVRPVRGEGPSRLHSRIGRIAAIGVLISGLGGLWMSASTFGIAQIDARLPAYPSELREVAQPLAPARIEALRALPAHQLVELSLPSSDRPDAVYTLKTTKGAGYLDAATGELVAWAERGWLARLFDLAVMLHTGRGAALWGLVLGLMVLSVPVLGVTGLLQWRKAQRGRAKIERNISARQAEILILVASEGGTSWGFGATLHRALTKQGRPTHLGALADWAPEKPHAAHHILILAATYGEGCAPASASKVLARLENAAPDPKARLAVLGFGDRAYPQFCGFARDIAKTAAEKGWQFLIETGEVNRQSAQDFARWGLRLGDALGLDLRLEHTPEPPSAQPLALISRQDFGHETQAPISILRFAPPPTPIWQRLAGTGFARFAPGDLLGILPQGSAVPRFYSLASGHAEGILEIVVRRQEGGLASGQLTALEPGGTAQGFLRRNPRFHAPRGPEPLILIGAGSGIGPLAGMIRANRAKRPIWLFYGLRHVERDLLYGTEMDIWRADGRLAQLCLAQSRSQSPQYVQDALRARTDELPELIRAGGRIMVCGGREMGQAVALAWRDILAPLDLTPDQLRAQGRYLEDVY